MERVLALSLIGVWLRAKSSGKFALLGGDAAESREKWKSAENSHGIDFGVHILPQRSHSESLCFCGGKLKVCSLIF